MKHGWLQLFTKFGPRISEKSAPHGFKLLPSDDEEQDLVLTRLVREPLAAGGRAQQVPGQTRGELSNKYFLGESRKYLTTSATSRSRSVCSVWPVSVLRPDPDQLLRVWPAAVAPPPDRRTELLGRTENINCWLDNGTVPNSANIRSEKCHNQLLVETETLFTIRVFTIR